MKRRERKNEAFCIRPIFEAIFGKIDYVIDGALEAVYVGKNAIWKFKAFDKVVPRWKEMWMRLKDEASDKVKALMDAIEDEMVPSVSRYLEIVDVPKEVIEEEKGEVGEIKVKKKKGKRFAQKEKEEELAEELEEIYYKLRPLQWRKF